MECHSEGRVKLFGEKSVCSRSVMPQKYSAPELWVYCREKNPSISLWMNDATIPCCIENLGTTFLLHGFHTPPRIVGNYFGGSCSGEARVHHGCKHLHFLFVDVFPVSHQDASCVLRVRAPECYCPRQTKLSQERKKHSREQTILGTRTEPERELSSRIVMKSRIVFRPLNRSQVISRENAHFPVSSSDPENRS